MKPTNGASFLREAFLRMKVLYFAFYDSFSKEVYQTAGTPNENRTLISFFKIALIETAFQMKAQRAV